jgi:hypothetical protein
MKQSAEKRSEKHISKAWRLNDAGEEKYTNEASA